MLPKLKFVQYFANSLFYAWPNHIWNKKDMFPCSGFHNLILKFSVLDQLSEQMKKNTSFKCQGTKVVIFSQLLFLIIIISHDLELSRKL